MGVVSSVVRLLSTSNPSPSLPVICRYHRVSPHRTLGTTLRDFPDVGKSRIVLVLFLDRSMVEMSSPIPAVYEDRTKVCLGVLSYDNVDQMVDSPSMGQSKSQ